MPMDPSNPIKRTESILKKIKPIAIITDENNDNLSVAETTKKFRLDEIINNNPNYINYYEKTIDLDPVYIITTSGSTGIPKGVAISHRSVIDYILWAKDTYGISQEVVIGNQAPFFFDNSVLDIYLMVFTGAKLVLIPDKLFLFPYKLVSYLNEKAISFIFWVPSIMANIVKFDILSENIPKYLRYILFAGEVMPVKVYNYWRKYLKDSVFSNLYGPTEITVDCTYSIVEGYIEESEHIPIGKPCRNTDVFLLNEDDNLITDTNTIGEICVKGSSLALGYFNDPEKTSIAFNQNPLNQNYQEKIYRTGDLAYHNENHDLIYVSRKDDQVKRSGYRIELGEIEKAVLLIEKINKACVIYAKEKNEIILIYESKNEIPLREILLELRQTLPKYMLPNKAYFLEALPINQNGKLDRPGLKALFLNGE